MNKSVSASMTSVEFSFRFTRIVKHSRLNSSRMFSVLNAFPSSVRQCTKSYDQTWLRYSGRNRMHALFYEFSIEDHVPTDHLLRSIDRFVDLGDMRRHLAPFYSSTGRPGVSDTI